MNKNAWRWELDSRDPDYDPPPENEMEEPAPEQEAIEDYIRNDYPRNYWPMRGDV